eukprot:scaffold9767_cov63-Phaeocystis_antarctica.AAC.1
MYVLAFLSLLPGGATTGAFANQEGARCTTIHSAPTHFALGIISARGAAAPPNPNHKKPHQLLSSQLSSPQPSPLALVAAALMPPVFLGAAAAA